MPRGQGEAWLGCWGRVCGGGRGTTACRPSRGLTAKGSCAGLPPRPPAPSPHYHPAPRPSELRPAQALAQLGHQAGGSRTLCGQGGWAGDKTSSAELSLVLASVPVCPLPQGWVTARAQRGTGLGQGPSFSRSHPSWQMPRCCLLTARVNFLLKTIKLLEAEGRGTGQDLTLGGRVALMPPCFLAAWPQR